jgi:hypothetical protein
VRDGAAANPARGRVLAWAALLALAAGCDLRPVNPNLPRILDHPKSFRGQIVSLRMRADFSAKDEAGRTLTLKDHMGEVVSFSATSDHAQVRGNFRILIPRTILVPPAAITDDLDVIFKMNDGDANEGNVAFAIDKHR